MSEQVLDSMPTSPQQHSALEATVDPFVLPAQSWFLAPSEALGDDEAQVLHQVFKRYRVPHTREMHRDYLCDLLGFLGYPRVKQEEVTTVLEQVCSYSELDVDEVQTVVTNFAHAEYARLRAAFDSLCETPGGKLSAGKAEHFLEEVGFVPERKCLAEALGGEGSADRALSFEQALSLVATYQRSRGLPRSDVARLRRIFRCLEVQPNGERHGHRGRRAVVVQAAGLPGMPVDELANAAIVTFGPSIEVPMHRVLSRLHAGELEQSQSSPNPRPGHRRELLAFSEVLALVQMARQLHLEDMRSAFKARCDDRGFLKSAGLRSFLRSLDIQPLGIALDEIQKQVGVSGQQSDLSFTDAAAIVLGFEERGGLVASEVEELTATFHKHCQPKARVLTSAKLAEILFNIGSPVLDGDLHTFTCRCELAHKGSLELPEFLKVMAVHRMEELRRLRKIFSSSGDDDPAIDKVGLAPEAALDGLRTAADGYLSPAVAEAISALSKARKRVDFDRFVMWADVCRKRGAEARKQHAGFKESDIVRFRDVFQQFDKEGLRVVTTTDLQALLDKLGLPVRTREEQRVMRENLDDARQAAREAGVEGVTPDGALTYGFWELVQLVRLLHRESDRAAREDAGRAAEELRFTLPEQAQFRKIFTEWSRLESGAGSLKVAAPTPDVDLAEGGISIETLFRLLRSIGLQLSREQKEELERQVAALQLPRRQLMFVDFLRMMRWLLDTDFAGINGVAATTAAKKQSQKNMSTVLS